MADRNRRSFSASCPSQEPYTPEELEFLQALDRYKRTRRRPFPAWTEVLAVLVSLGWRKAEAAGPLPGPPDPPGAGS